MASNVAQQSVPYYWTSANDDIEYTFSFNPYSIDSVANSGGNVRVNLQNDFDITPLPGEYIYIINSIYAGRHLILSVISTSAVVIDLAYTTTIVSNAFNCLHLRIPTFSLYKGFKIGENYDTDLLYTRVVDIKPSLSFAASGTPFLSLNIKGVARYLFTIVSNTVANSIDFSMFNAVRLIWDGLSTVSSALNDYTLVLNSALTNDEIVYQYLDYGNYLIPIDKPLIATRGVTFATIFDVDTYHLPVVHKFINGVKQ